MTRGNSGGPYYSSVASWYGANTALAHRVGELLGGVAWAGVPFAGGMCELRYLKARSLVVSDKHRHVINLARVIADRDLWGELVRRLNRLPFHPDVLAESQARCE